MKLTNDQAKGICKVGQGEDCCIYLLMGPKGWECAKSDKKIKAQLHERWLAGTTNAKGVGDLEDCPFILRGIKK